MPRRQKLSAADFDLLLKLNGFTQLRCGDVLDLRAGRASLTPDRMRPILRGRQTDRQATFDAMLRLRAARNAEQEAREAREAETQRIAEAIAPRALPPARASLEGPSAVAQLADDFLTLTTISESAGMADLLLKGWRRDQVIEHLDAARRIAYSRQEGVAA